MQRLIDEFEGQGIIIGGVAVSLLGRARYTADADAIIFLSIDDLPKLLRAAANEGFTPRVANFKALARASRILLLRHDKTGITADISLGTLPFEAEAIQRSQLVPVGRLRIPSVEALIVLKAIAHCPKDLLDIESLVQVHPDLDQKRIETWVKDFGKVLESPELWDDIAPMLRKK